MKNLTGIIIVAIVLIFLRSVYQAAISKDGDLLNLAEQSFLDGKLEVSLDYYSRLIDAYPDDWLYYYNRAMLQLWMDDTTSAAIDFYQAHQKKPKDPWSLYQMALVNRSRGADSLAIINLLHALSLDKKHVLALTNLAELQILQNNVAEGLEYAAKAVKYDEALVSARIILAQCLFKNGNPESALEVIDEAVKQFPQSNLLKFGFTAALDVGDSVRAEQYGAAYLNLYPHGWWRSNVLKVFPNSDTTVSNQRVILQSAVNWLRPGDRYSYRGKWGLLSLGRLDIEIGQLTVIGGQECIPISYHIQSNPFLMVIKIDDLYQAYVTPDMQRTLRYDMRVRETWWKYDRQCIMDSENGRLVQRVIENDGRIRNIEQELPANLIDGTSLLFYARTLVRDRRSSRAITLIDYNFAWTNIEFTGKKEKIKIVGVKREAWVVNGSADYTGIAGMSGSFKGWFSDDEDALPLKAMFKIFIGSVKLFLKK